MVARWTLNPEIRVQFSVEPNFLLINWNAIKNPSKTLISSQQNQLGINPIFIRFVLTNLLMSIEKNLIAFIDKAQENLKHKKDSESLKKSGVASYDKPNCMASADLQSENSPLNTSDEKSTVLLLKEIAELKELFKSQDEIMKKRFDDEISEVKCKEIQELTGEHGDDGLIIPLEMNRVSGEYNQPVSMLASTLVGVTSRTLEEKKPSESFLNFASRSKPWKISEKALIQSSVCLFYF